VAEQECVKWLTDIQAAEDAALESAITETEKERDLVVIASQADPEIRPPISTLKNRPKRVPMEHYVEKWRVLLWEKAYGPFFHGPNQYSKSHSFVEQAGTDNAWKRLLYRYFKRE